ncbi:MAG: peptidoglycan-binding protein, partial [Acidimicrobiales bacterium]
MADLQQRLTGLGLGCRPDSDSLFGAGTAAAVEAFQYRRGLRVDGICGPQTWGALVEAGFRLGDRFLYLRAPMLRGDDVADLQQRLSALGFDTGRVDGIFGGLTSTALGDFQRNVSLPVDGILGASTLRELKRVMPRHVDPQLVSAVRDRERLRQVPGTLLGRRFAIGEEGGLDVLVTAVRRHLSSTGAEIIPLLHPDGSLQAAAANAAEVEAYVGLRLDPDATRCAAAYYAGYSYESAGGRRLAEALQSLAAEALGIPADGARGMSLPVLRETRMPAVIGELGPPSLVVARAAVLARA